MPMSQFVLRLQKEEERIRNTAVRHAINPANSLKGRPSADNLRETNIKLLVQQYHDTPELERDRLNYLTTIQYHLSKAAYAKLEVEKENHADTPSTSQSSQEGPRSTQAFVADLIESACSSAPATGTAIVTEGRSLSPFDFGV
ncbi:hypothetical protein AAVH_23811 [Aphelenchoides avenae]|nr:hypothetical protein AAVH_23811 [Aphelenchus avenae]